MRFFISIEYIFFFRLVSILPYYLLPSLLLLLVLVTVKQPRHYIYRDLQQQQLASRLDTQKQSTCRDDDDLVVALYVRTSTVFHCRSLFFFDRSKWHFHEEESGDLLWDNEKTSDSTLQFIE